MLTRKECDYHGLWHVDYSLMYLDPIICDASLRVKRPTLGWYGSDPDMKARQLLNQIETQLNLDPNRDERHAYLDSKGAGERLKNNRRLQSAMVRDTTNLDSELGGHKCCSLEELQSKADTVAGLADWSDWHSLVVVDAGFAHSRGTPEKFMATVQTPTIVDPRDARGTVGMLTGYPGRMAVLGDPVIGVRADLRAFYDWTEDFIHVLSAGWHPFAKVIATYNTSSQGKPYLDLVAIMLRRCPSLREVIRGTVYTYARKQASLKGEDGENRGGGGAWIRVGLLDAMRSDTLKLRSEIERLKSLAPKENGSGEPKTAEGNGKASGESLRTNPMQTQIPDSEMIPFEVYREYLVPIHHFHLICTLNGVSATTLESYAYPAFHIFKDYLTVIRDITQFCDEQSRHIHQQTDITKLLPEPATDGIRMIGRATP